MSDPYVNFSEHSIVRLAQRAIGFDLEPYLERAREAIKAGRIELTFQKRENEYIVRMAELDLYAVFVKKPTSIVVKTFLTPEHFREMQREYATRKRLRKQYLRDVNQERIEAEIRASSKEN